MLSGIGAGVVIAALFDFVVAAVDDDEVGSASGVFSAVQSIGSSVGVAAVGSAFFGAIKTGTATDGYHHALLIQAPLLARLPRPHVPAAAQGPGGRVRRVSRCVPATRGPERRKAPR